MRKDDIEISDLFEVICDLKGEVKLLVDRVDKIDSMYIQMIPAYKQLISDYDTTFDNFREFIRDEKDRRLKEKELVWKIVYGLLGFFIGTSLQPLVQNVLSKFIGG